MRPFTRDESNVRTCTHVHTTYIYLLSSIKCMYDVGNESRMERPDRAIQQWQTAGYYGLVSRTGGAVHRVLVYSHQRG